MALSPRQKLAVHSAARKKRKEQTEQQRVDELTSLVNSVVSRSLIHGKDGAQGQKGDRGLQGPQGLPGKDGRTEIIVKTEPLPDDLVKEDTLQSLREDIETVKRAQKYSLGGGTNSGEGIKYVKITTPSYKIGRGELLRNGITIFGVNYAGDVSITLPQPRKNQMVYINDESGSAGSNNITVTTIQ